MESVSGDHMTGNDQEIERHDAGMDVVLESVEASPGASAESADPLQGGDAALYPGPKVPQLPVDPLAAGHVEYFPALSLGEDHVLDPLALGKLEVVAGSESAIRGNLSRISSVDLLLPNKAPFEQRRVGRIALLHHMVDDQRGPACGQRHLVTEQRLPPVLDDDVGVRLEDRNDLFRGRHLFSVDHPAPGLIHDLDRHVHVVVHVVEQALRSDAVVLYQHRTRSDGIGRDLLAESDQLPVHLPLFLPIPEVPNLFHPSFGGTAMIDETTAVDQAKLFGADHQSRQYSNGIPEEARVGGMMDGVGHHGGIGARHSSFLDVFLRSIADDDPIDLLPRGGFDSTDVALQGCMAKRPGKGEPGEPAGRIGVRQVKGQFPVGAVEKPHQYGAAKHLLGRHTGIADVVPAVAGQVFEDELDDGRIGVEDGGHGRQLFGKRMIGKTGRQRHLFLAILAHLASCLLRLSPVVSFVLALLILQDTQQNCKALMRFFCLFSTA